MKIKLTMLRGCCWSGGYTNITLCKWPALVNLELEIVGGFWRIFGFVDMSALGMLMVPSSWLKCWEFTSYLYCDKCRMSPSYFYCFPGLSRNLLAVWSNDFKLGNICLGMAVGGTVLVTGAGGCSVIFFDTIL